jgi:ABC-type branched-subunit amino acid transport system substrate-binding protein
MTNNHAFMGEDVQNGLRLALDEINNNYDNKFNYELIVEDNGFENRKTVLATQKLLNVNKVDVVLSLWADNTEVVAPLVLKSKAWNAAICWDPTIAAKFPKTVVYETSIDEYAKGFASLFNEQKQKRVTVVMMKAYSFEVALTKLKEFTAGTNSSIVHVHKFNPGERSFKSIISQISPENTDVVLLFSYLPEIELFLKEYNDLKVEVPITGAFESLQNLKLIEGSTYYDHAFATDDFNKKFKSRYGKNYLVRAPDAYDFMKMIAQAYEASAGDAKPTAEEAIAEMEKLDYSGALGPVRIQDRAASPKAQKVTIRDGKKVKL